MSPDSCKVFPNMLVPFQDGLLDQTLAFGLIRRAQTQLGLKLVDRMGTTRPKKLQRLADVN